MKKKYFVRRSKLKKIIDTAQRTGEEFAVMSRSRAMEYDQVLQRQRSLIYETRNQLLDGEELEIKKILQIAKSNIREFLDEKTNRNLPEIRRYILDNLSYRLDENLKVLPNYEKEALVRFLTDIVLDGLKMQEERLGSKEKMNDFMRIATLQAVDDAWVEQVDYLQQLQYAVSGRSSAQRNPLYEYQRDALESLQRMEKTIRKNIIRNILLSDVQINKEQKLQILFP